MMPPLHLVVVTPDHVVIDIDVDWVVAPNTGGEFGVWPGHESFITQIAPGELRYAVGEEVHHYTVTHGFAEVHNDKVIVLADASEDVEHIDVGRAKRALERAQHRLYDADQENVDAVRAEAALRRAMIRLWVAGRPWRSRGGR